MSILVLWLAVVALMRASYYIARLPGLWRDD